MGTRRVLVGNLLDILVPLWLRAYSGSRAREWADPGMSPTGALSAQQKRAICAGATRSSQRRTPTRRLTNSKQFAAKSGGSQRVIIDN